MSELWAVHVEGPDDVLPARTREEADERAAAMNEAYQQWAQRTGANPDVDPRWHATVIRWPYDAEGHAESLAELDAEGYQP